MGNKMKYKIHMRLNIEYHNIASQLHAWTRSPDLILFSKGTRHRTGYGCVHVS